MLNFSQDEPAACCWLGPSIAASSYFGVIRGRLVRFHRLVGEMGSVECQKG
jgi:hypothetical protein